MTEFNVNGYIKLYYRCSDILIIHNKHGYTLWDVGTCKKVKSFKIPTSKDEQEKKGLFFTILSRSEIFEHKSGVIYDFALEEQKFDIISSSAAFKISDRELILHERGISYWDISRWYEEDSEYEIADANVNPEFHIPETRKIVAIEVNDLDTEIMIVIDIDTKQKTTIYNEGMGARFLRVKSDPANLTGNIVLFDNYKIVILDKDTYKQIKQIKIPIIDDKKITEGKRVAIYDLINISNVYIMTTEIGLYSLSEEKELVLINPNIKDFAIMYNIPHRGEFIVECKIKDSNKLLFVSYNDLTSVRAEISVPRDSIVKFESFHVQEEREYIFILVNYLTRYVASPLAKIIGRFFLI